MAGTERGRGWGAVVGLTLLAAALSVVHPGLLIFTPLALLLLALPPRRPALVVLGAALLAVALAGRAGDAVWYIERGWVLVLGAWFVLAVVAWPRARFVSRALAAVGATLATAVLLVALARGGFATLDWWVAERLRRGAADAASAWGSGLGFERIAQHIAEAAYRIAELQIMLYPALLALASLAALAVAWWAHQRLANEQKVPLGRLREFRFHDALVWLLIAGLLLLLLPGGTRIGTNVLVFMTALYALRGLAVLISVLVAPNLVAAIVAVALAVLLYPIALLFAALVGLSDTWLDIRNRSRARVMGGGNG